MIPWNFPLLMLAWKLAPALACGNCAVLKPAETTSVTALKFAEILRDAELPPGVVNFVCGAGEVGAEVVRHPLAAKVAFTGSTDVGKAIMRETAGSGKRLTLELGGKAANIVFDDAPLDQAVEGVVNGIYFNQGHVCCAGSRLLVQESIAERFRRQAQDSAGQPARGQSPRQEHRRGRDQFARTTPAHPRDGGGRREGRRGAVPAAGMPVTRAKGIWFAPSIFTGVTPSHRIAREEIFGPVLSVLTFPHDGGSHREGEQHRLRALGGRVDGQGLADFADERHAQGGRHLGEHLQSVRSLPRRLAGTRKAGSDARAAGKVSAAYVKLGSIPS